MQDYQSSEKYDVFISYGRKDYEYEYVKNGKKIKELIPNNPIIKIVEQLQQEGVTCWYDQKGVSSRFLKLIKQKIDASTIMVFVSSAYSNQSRYTSSEIAYATGQKKQIIAFKIDNTEYNDDFAILLAPVQNIDTFPTNPEKALQELIKCIKESLKQIEDEKNRKEREQREKERLEKEEAERKALIANLNADIAELVQQEAEANSARQNLAQKIAASADKSVREEFFAKLDESGVLHVENKQTEQKLKRLRSILSIVSVVALAIIAFSFLLLGTKWLSYNKLRKSLEEEQLLLKIQNDSLISVNDSLQSQISTQKNNIDSMQRIINKEKAIIPNFEVESTNIHLPASSGRYMLTVKSDGKWKIDKEPSNSFVQLTQHKTQVEINYAANLTASERNSTFTITSLSARTQSKTIQITQSASNDTIIILKPLSVKLDAERDKEKGIEIICPFRVNHINKELSVRAFFYHNGKPIITDENNKRYIGGRNRSNEPILATPNETVNCIKTGSDFSNFKVFIPYSVFPKQVKNIQYRMVFSSKNEILYQTGLASFTRQ